ncbi:MAG TPA: sensor histidine kinase [Steroidobacteraceae bacterium]|nr:sensor histidine kinase [Steroidobacteraceae bacterium]
MTIRRQLVRLVAATVIPAAVCTTLLIGYAHDRQRALVEDRTLDVARALAQTVDRELARYQAAMAALATSPHLSSGDLAAFHRQARHAMRELPGDIFVLSDASGQQLVNTQQPFGEPLPRRASVSQVRQVFETGKPAISDLFVGETARRLLVAIDVPVRLDDRVAYALALAVFPERLGEILKYQKIQPDWVVSIFDSQGTIVARNHAAEQFIGQKGAPALVQRMAQVAEGRVETETLEGIPVVAVFSRSAVSLWSVAIGIPRGTVASALWTPISLIIAGAVVLLLSGIVMAQRLGARIAGSIRGLIPPAVALGRGDPVVVPPLHLREADDVGRELVSASERLHERERTLALVSHDLRSPLNVFMIGAATVERLAQRLPGGEPICDVAASLTDLTRRMSGMVDDLLSIAVATGGGRSLLKIAPVSTASLMKRAAAAAWPLFERGDIRLEVESVGALPELEVDSNRVLRVFANLIDNALKFTDPQGRVVLRAEAESDAVRFCVANSGPALSAAELQSMFKPFWQAGQGDRRGAGLGLSICRSIVEAHGGRIWAEPEPGKRVRIWFTLPSAAVSSPAAAV